jgi:DNA-binding beta-propeller fold protein YncE
MTAGHALGKCDAASNWEIWVPRQNSNDIKIVNGPEFTLAEEKTIDLSMTGLKLPHGVAFNKDLTRALVAMLGTPEAQYADGGVVLIDATTRTVIRSIVTNAKTHAVTFAPNGEIWAANVNSPGTLSFINADSGMVTGTLEVGGQAVATRFSSDGTKAYVTNQAVVDETNSLVHVVNVGTKALDGNAYKTGKQTVSPVMTTDGKLLYVTNGLSNSIDKIDLSMTDRAAAVTEFAKDIAESHAIALGKDHIFVTARMGARVVVLDREGVAVKNIPVEVTGGNPIPDMIAMSPSCQKAYFTERFENKLHQIDVETLAITGSVNLAEGYTHGVTVRVVAGDM